MHLLAIQNGTFSRDRQIYVHPTCATDTENIEVVDAALQDVIMDNILRDTMIN